MLKALELAGFKSFADKTRLDFHSGVTCVVGPNGSGKSNVVDAIKWVTGTQSAKALRGKEMTDVIFSGSSSRKPMNAAEVTLEFDNSEGLFDLQTPVARITRRVYRSGEGEYLINGAPSRLRDIRAMLAGTGVGAESYSIIEQGRVDAMLSASPRDRRGIFEEAAGVSRFRLKKNEAAKRMARVEQNLLRLSDIVDEVEGRLRRVKKQAGKAAQYRDSAERLKQLRTSLGLVDYRSFNKRSERLETDIARLTEEQEFDSTTLNQAEEELERLEVVGQEATSRLTEVDHQLASLREQMGAARATTAAQSARLAELEDDLIHKRNRLVGALAQSGKSDEASDQSLAEQLEQAERAFGQEAASLAQAQTELADSESRLHELVASSQATQDHLQEAEHQAGELGQQAETHKSAVREHERRRESLAKKQQQAGNDCRELDHELQQLKQSAEQAATELEQSSAALAARQQGTAKLRAELSALQKQLSAVESEIVSLRHQLEAANQLETDLESLRDNLRDNGARPWSVLGFVADVLHVDYDSAPMVEAALGERAHHLVVDSGSALLESLAQGSASLASRTSLERLDCQAAASVVDRVDLSSQPGVMGRADQFVECDEPYGSLVRRLLGRVWFVDSLETAERLASGVGRGLSFVTYQGESLTADGVLTVGPKDDSRNLLTRKARAGEIRDALAEAERLREELRTQTAELESAIAESQTAEHAELDRRTQAADAHAEARHAAQRVEETLASRRAAQAKKDEEQAEVGTSIEATRVSLQEAIERRQALETELIELRRRSEELSAEEKELTVIVEQLRAALVKRQLAVAKAEQRVEVLQTQLQQSQNSGAKQQSTRHDAISDVAECRRRIAEHELLLLAARASLDGLWLAAEQLAAARRSASTEATLANQRRGQIAQAVRQRREVADRCVAQRQKCELELSKIRQQQATLAGRLLDDYSIDLSQAAANDQQPDPIEDRQAVEREIAKLRENVNSAGAVNLESIEELDDLEARFNELSAQYQDLTDAKNSLERLTQRLNVETRKMFLTTVENVRGEFRELFRQLFGGGEADIVLVDAEGEDPLDAGVEIAAQPPGKELSNITLLSGGEKTMTCVALLLALFRSKPSPFCVLDEVDAALDEANIGRFTGVLNEFLASTQFIVITHSKKTMTGADTMYGVTMQESGVSKQVAVRFEEVDDQGQIHPGRMLREEKRAA